MNSATCGFVAAALHSSSICGPLHHAATAGPHLQLRVALAQILARLYHVHFVALQGNSSLCFNPSLSYATRLSTGRIALFSKNQLDRKRT